jgi:hypothetical protein
MYLGCHKLAGHSFSHQSHGSETGKVELCGAVCGTQRMLHKKGLTGADTLTSYFPFTDHSLYLERASSEMSVSQRPPSQLTTAHHHPPHTFNLEIHTNNPIAHQ